jgi:hypothetical protein
MTKNLVIFLLFFTLVYCSAYSSTLKMEAICSSETSVHIQRTTRRYIPEDSTLHNHRCEHLKSYIIYINLGMIRALLKPLSWQQYESCEGARINQNPGNDLYKLYKLKISGVKNISNQCD